MKKINPFYEEKAVPVDGTFKELKNLCLKPYDKETASPFIKIILVFVYGLAVSLS